MIVLWLLGCPKAPPSDLDPTLPEAIDPQPTGTPVELLLSHADSSDPDRRAAALEGLIRYGPDDSVADWVARGTYDTSASVQMRTVQAARTRQPIQGVQPALSAAMDREGTDPYVRAHLSVVLDRAIAQTDLADVSAPWDRAPLLLFSDIEAREEGFRHLASGDIRAESQFFEDLETLDGPELRGALEKTVLGEPELALLAQVTRFRLGEKAGRVALKRALLHDDISIAFEAMDHVMRLPSPLREQGLEFALQGAPETRLAADIYHSTTPGTPLGPLEAAVTHPRPDLRQRGLEVIGRRRGLESRSRHLTMLDDWLKAGLKDRSPQVRKAAVQGLTPTQADLTPLLQDPDHTVRMAVAIALLELTP